METVPEHDVSVQTAVSQQAMLACEPVTIAGFIETGWEAI